MTNIAILTINDNNNYGNRLQNYALSKVLSRYGSCTTIKMYCKVDNHIAYLTRSLYSLAYNIIKFALPSEISALRTRRYYKIYQFTKKYVPNNLLYLSQYGGLKSNNNQHIDYLVIGSDQVWNCRWLTKNDLALRLGSFCIDQIPVISYSASLGINEIPDEYIPIFKKYLPKFKSISVREDTGAKLLHQIIKKNVTVVLDPTLMLTALQWKKIINNVISNDENYILTYFLGKPNASQEHTIQEYAKARHLKIHRLLDIDDKSTYTADPSDFVELIAKAKYVFTDSYHACCFSIIFHKQFTVFNRSDITGKLNMNSRMETLFRLFNLESVVMDKGLAPEINYIEVENLLKQHRIESQTWLDNAMNEA